jgi:GTPase-associated protein 1, N-terminal domain type 2/GTPase-associated protein 1, middle domain
MSPGFERVLYTDCAPGRGRGGGGGFQIQAQSAGTRAMQVKSAVSLLMYATQTPWMNARRPVEDYPFGLAHMAENGYGTGFSRYLGKEVNGTREGNHLADCLLTTDTGGYGAVRPAQLWRSGFWRGQPFDTTECPAFTDLLELGPLDHDELQDWLQAQPERGPLLERLVSVLEDPAGPMVQIVSPSADEAVTWIAAATVMLPQRAALDISFKVFANSLNQIGHRIIAVPKELFPSVQPGRPGSIFVLDTETLTSDEHPVGERARYWVSRLREAVEPYDVVEAVELAATLTGGPGLTDADLRDTAWAIAAEEEPILDAGPLRRWLVGSPPIEVAEHGPAIAARILDGDPSADALRLVDRESALGHFVTDRRAVRQRLLAAEIAEAQDGVAIAAEDLDRIAWDPETERDAESMLGSGIVLGDDRTTALLLRLARRHGFSLRPASPAVLQRLTTFVQGWLAAPSTTYPTDRWALEDEFVDLLKQELQTALARGDHAAVRALIPQVYKQLLVQGNDLDDPVTWEIEAFWLTRKPAEELGEWIGRLLDTAADEGAIGDTALLEIQRAAVRWNAVSHPVALELAARIPEHVPLDPVVARAAVAAVTGSRRAPTLPVLRAVAQLDRRGLVTADAAIADVLEQAQDLESFLDQAVRLRDARAISRLNGGFRTLSRAQDSVVVGLAPTLADVAIQAPLSEVGAKLLVFLPSSSVGSFVDAWRTRLYSRAVVDATAAGLGWLKDSDVTDALRVRIATEILDLAGLYDAGADRDKWESIVRGRLDSTESAFFDQLLAQVEGNGRSRRKGSSR